MPTSHSPHALHTDASLNPRPLRSGAACTPDRADGPRTAPASGSAGGFPGFAPGTRIATQDGELPVEWLSAGDKVITRDDGLQPLRWIGRPQLTAAQRNAADQRPVALARDHFGQGFPNRPLVLAPRHRILVSGPALQLLFGFAEALCDARDLAPPAPAAKAPRRGQTSYLLLFDRHQIVMANGIWTESLFAGRHSGAVEDAFGGAPSGILHRDTARPCLKAWETGLIAQARHREPAMAPAGVA